MSRSEKRRRREQRERLRGAAPSFRQFKRQQANVRYEAQELIDEGRLREARHVLEQHSASYPSHTDPLHLLLNVYHWLGDYAPYCRTCERLLQLEPHNHELHLPMASAYQLNMRPA